MSDVMGIIYTSKDDFKLRELTAYRAVAALPVAGRYRIIDFTLSNLVNSGVRNVGVIAQRNYHSLMDHLGSGKEWDLHTRNNGLFILPPFLTSDNGGEYSGVVEALRSNFDYLRRSQQKYVILTSSDYIMNASFEPMIEQHIRTGADVTLMYRKVSPRDPDYANLSQRSNTYIDVSPEDGIVRDMEVHPNAASYDNLYLEVMMIKRTLLIHLINQSVAHGGVSVTKDILSPFIRSGSLKVMGYRMDGYYRRIENIKSYFNFNLDLLSGNVRRELFGKNPIYTKTRDDVPAIYREGAQVRNSLVADGCIVEGSVENCVLFRGVHIGRGACLKNCIVMQDSSIGEYAELENAILDKVVTVRRGERLIAPKQYPIVVGKAVTV
ncbi:MAG: glucose-1-phosphate adenylyltransferase subunit GlgD [Clostridia bacterium]|nr:glucose-1-phosphate adenylyltransferase subunit GlgD [Clostridia bacterium]